MSDSTATDPADPAPKWSPQRIDHVPNWSPMDPALSPNTSRKDPLRHGDPPNPGEAKSTASERNHSGGRHQATVVFGGQADVTNVGALHAYAVFNSDNEV